MKKIIDIVAPASKAPQEVFENGLKWIKTHGFIPRYQKDIMKQDLFFASTLENQIEHFVNALYSSDSDIIWCLRGGYGSMRLIPHLAKLKKPKKEKIFIGFSDITSLHLFLTQKWGWTTYHGMTVSQIFKFADKTPDCKEFLELLKTGDVNPHYKKLTPMNKAAMASKTIKSSVTGGNLRLVQSSLNTDHELEAKKKILFLEDVGERGYSIDRMLEQLNQTGMIKKVDAVVFGDFTEGLEKDGKDLTGDALQRFADKAKFPVLKGLPCGHGKHNRLLPFNQKCELKLGKLAELKF